VIGPDRTDPGDKRGDRHDDATAWCVLQLRMMLARWFAVALATGFVAGGWVHADAREHPAAGCTTANGDASAPDPILVVGLAIATFRRRRHRPQPLSIQAVRG
jgi:MYXO-CTERM domain-containing protein